MNNREIIALLIGAGLFLLSVPVLHILSGEPTKNYPLFYVLLFISAGLIITGLICLPFNKKVIGEKQ